MIFLFAAITWKHEAVLLLISLYGENKEKFTCSSYKQKDVWKIISTKMFEKGLNYDANQCNEKFRSLKHRYTFFLHSCYPTSSMAHILKYHFNYEISFNSIVCFRHRGVNHGKNPHFLARLLKKLGL
jgi:hypothetical protein